jgi:hypothetical protein
MEGQYTQFNGEHAPPPQGQYPGYVSQYPNTGNSNGNAVQYQYTQAIMPPPPQQPTVVYVHQRPAATVVYTYSYSQRARFVYWGNPFVRLLTLLFIALVITGIVLEATSSTECRSGCTETPCTA